MLVGAGTEAGLGPLAAICSLSWILFGTISQSKTPDTTVDKLNSNRSTLTTKYMPSVPVTPSNVTSQHHSAAPISIHRYHFQQQLWFFSFAIMYFVIFVFSFVVPYSSLVEVVDLLCAFLILVVEWRHILTKIGPRSHLYGAPIGNLCKSVWDFLNSFWPNSWNWVIILRTRVSLFRFVFAQTFNCWSITDFFNKFNFEPYFLEYTPPPKHPTNCSRPSDRTKK